MALWPSGFDPFVGGFGGRGAFPDPSGFGGFGGFGGFCPAGGFFDPFWSPGAAWAPGTTAGTRRHLAGTSGGAGGGWQAGGTGAGPEGPPPLEAEGGEGEARRRRTRDPYVVGPAGWTRSIPCDFIERDKEYVVRADIPGCKKSEIHVDVHDGNVLRFGQNPNAEREKEDVEEEGIFHRTERITTFRNRNLRLPDDADAENIQQATLEDGVLQIIIPKKVTTEQKQQRLLQIQ